jgi:SAM-dependent methyltransferase
MMKKPIVLEAGCGSGSRFEFGSKATVFGIDISLNQLQNNKVLHHRILGDIQELNFRPASFDVIVCWDVLEHLQRPETALLNFFHTLSNEGILIIGIPNIMSLKGMFTKLTPNNFHRWVYKKIYKYDNTPFPSYHQWKIAPKFLLNIADDKGIYVFWSHFSDRWIKFLKKRSLFLYYIYYTLGISVKLITLGKVKFRKTEFMIIYKKSKKLKIVNNCPSFVPFISQVPDSKNKSK